MPKESNQSDKVKQDQSRSRFFFYTDEELKKDLQCFKYDHSCIKKGLTWSINGPFTVKAIFCGILLWLNTYTFYVYPVLFLTEQLTFWAAFLTTILMFVSLYCSYDM